MITDKTINNAVVVLAAAASSTLVGLGIKENIQKKIDHEPVSKEATDTDKELMKAAWKNKLEVFKTSLENGADITTLNKLGQNALMAAVDGQAYDVAKYILETPEIASKIDYKQCDRNGYNISDYIETKLLENKSIEIIHLKRKVNEHLEMLAL